jgi:hypothetical protein
MKEIIKTDETEFKLVTHIDSTKKFYVNQLGQVIGARGKLIKGKTHKNYKTRMIDYFKIVDGIKVRKSSTINTLVFKTFNPEVDLTDKIIVQKDETDKSFPFRLSNLEVTTRAVNVKKCLTSDKISRSFYNNFSNEELNSLIENLSSSNNTIKELATRYGTSRMSINRAKKRLLNTGFKKF